MTQCKLRAIKLSRGLGQTIAQSVAVVPGLNAEG